MDDIATEHRFRIRVIGIETTAAIVSYADSVNKNDRRISAFENHKKSTGNKVGTGALNIVFGLGSYLEGDISGGITITIGYLISAGLMATEALALDWDNMAVGVPATIGFTAAGLTIVYGFVRPFIYNRSPRFISVMDNIQARIVMTSGNNDLAFQLSYSIKF